MLRRRPIRLHRAAGGVVQKFYLHNAATGNTGTLPGASNITGLTVVVTATGASTNRSADGTPGASQVSQALTTSGTTSGQTNWFRRYLTPPLAAGTYTLPATAAAKCNAGISQSNTNSAMKLNCGIRAWRPGTGAVVGGAMTLGGTQAADAVTTEINYQADNGGGSTLALTLLDGDILVFEVFGFNIQSMGTAYTNTLFYDGTTDASTTSNAAYVDIGVDIPLLPAAATATPQPRAYMQAVKYAATRCSVYKRRSGLLVPRLWLPAGA